MPDFTLFAVPGAYTLVTPLSERAHEHGEEVAIPPDEVDDAVASLVRQGFTVELPDGQTAAPANLCPFCNVPGDLRYCPTCPSAICVDCLRDGHDAMHAGV